MKLAELAAAIDGRVEGDGNVEVLGATGLEDAGPGVIVRVENERYLDLAHAGPAAALLTDEELSPLAKPAIRVKHVRLGFAKCLEALGPRETAAAGIHPTAVVGGEAEIHPSASIGALAVIGRGVRIAAGAVIHPHVTVGDEAEIGPDAVIYPQVTLYPRTVVGARVRIQSGAVIGAAGYGYEWTGREHYRIPQIGRVRLCDDVDVGANACIDRATTGETVIGPGTKIDNLVQIGHNVRTGAHCLIVSQVGIAGSTTLGNGVVLAGQVGVKDHITIGDGVQAAGQSGIWGDQPPGVKLSGNPARPHREEIRIQAALSQLPELLKRVRALEKALAERE